MVTTSLPTGTVTFLMTDVEGSTPLWETDAAAMSAAMARHDEIIERAVAERGGVVVKPRGEGDSRFCVFEDAPQPVGAAIEIQRALQRARWPTREPIRVRIALYTGHAEVRDPEYGEYYGTAPNRCARLRDLGHGGQVLLSASAVALVAGELPDKAELIALGSYRLRGIELPEPVHQLAHPDLAREFGPLRGGAPGNVPVPLTSFIGRAAEIADLRALLDGHRLVTLTGAAGVGKTRLAIEVARNVSSGFPDGAWLCELAPTRDPAAVPRVLLGAFGLTEERERSIEQILTDYVRDKRLLVVLDNCEHVLGACADLCAHLLRVSPRCSILVTSREPLSVEGEAIRRVPSMTLPEAEDAPLQDLAGSESVTLFCERGRAGEAAFVLNERTAPAVAQICRRLDGIPLAIELAAGKLNVLGVGEIARGVEDRFALLTGGPRTALERQQTMRAAVDWSYSLLSTDESAVLRRLGVLVGGFTMDAARDVCAGATENGVEESIASLVRKSLVAKDGERPGRYLLLETIRAYAAEKLADAGEAVDASARHLHFFCALAAQAADPLEGGPDQQDWLECLEAEHDNLQAALQTAELADPDGGLKLGADVAEYWEIRGHWRPGRRALESLLVASGDRSTIDRARALRAAGRFAAVEGDGQAARVHYEESLAIARELGDRRLSARVVGDHGLIALEKGDYEEARVEYEASLAIARELCDRHQIAWVVGALGWIAQEKGDFEEARVHIEESLAIAHEIGERRLSARMVGALGWIALAKGDYEEARVHIEESLAGAREIGDRHQIAWMVGALGWIAQERGDFEKARAHFEDSLAIAHELGERRLSARMVGALGWIALAKGDYEQARVHTEESLVIAREIGDRREIAWMVGALGWIALAKGDYEQARVHFEDSLAIAHEIGDRRLTARMVGALGWIALAKGDDARAHFEESLAIAHEIGDRQVAARALLGGATVAEAVGDYGSACTLAAAAEAARERIGFAWDKLEQTQFDELVARLHETLDPQVFEAVWARGRAMSVEQALDMALGRKSGN